jgi:hypothetical protein
MKQNNMYNLYLHHGDYTMGKYKVRGDDMDKVYQCFGAKIIRQGFEYGVSIPQQIKKYQSFMKAIQKQKENCEKIRASDLYMYLSCYCALYKFHAIEEDHMFLKIKKRKRL